MTTSSTDNIFKSTVDLSIFLQFHRTSVDSEIDLIKEYIIDCRNNIKKQQGSFNAMIEEEKKKHLNNIHDLIEHYEQQYYQINEFYPATFNSSTLLSLYSLFEFNLKSLCVKVQNYEEMKIKLDDINGKGYIDKSRKYLNLVVGLDLTELDSTWTEITFFQRIRNSIVHNNSNIVKKKNQIPQNLEIYNEIKNNPNLKINKTGTFIISDDQFLLDVSDTIKKYLLTVIKKLEEKNR